MAGNKAEVGTRENPCTMKNSKLKERVHKYCLCEECGTVAKLTFGFDFYESADGVFRCEDCFRGFVAWKLSRDP